MPAVESVPLYLLGHFNNYAAWSLLPVIPDLGILSHAWISVAGTLLFFGAAAGFFWFDRKVKWGIAWYTAFVLLPLYANGGSPAPHYSYAAAFGLLLAIFRSGQILLAHIPQMQPVVLAAGLIWLTATTFHWPSDLRHFRVAGKVGLDTRHQLILHQNELLDAGSYYLTGAKLPLPPLLVAETRMIEFDLGQTLQTRRPPNGECPHENAYPCISMISKISDAYACADTPPGGCITYVSARRSP